MTSIAGPHEPCNPGSPEQVVRAWISRPRTLSLIRRWLGVLGAPESESLDLAQDVIVQCLRSAGSYRPDVARVERWANRIAVHTTAKSLARARRWREVPVACVPDEGYEPDLGAELAAAQTVKVVREAVATLPDGLRELVLAVDIGGGSMESWAVARGLPVSTAYKWRARGRALLEEGCRRAA